MFVKADKGTTNNKNDKVMTPDNIAKFLINLLPIQTSQKIYDPFMGTGACFIWWKRGYRGDTQIEELKV